MIWIFTEGEGDKIKSKQASKVWILKEVNLEKCNSE